MTATVDVAVNVAAAAIDKKPGPLLAELSRSIARSIFRVRVCVSAPAPTCDLFGFEDKRNRIQLSSDMQIWTRTRVSR